MLTRPASPHFGTVLKTLRTASGLTQEVLAQRARLSKRGLQDIERGVSQAPRRDTVEQIATALGLAAADRAALLAAARPSPVVPARSEHAALAPASTPVPLVGRQRELALLDRFLADKRDPLGSAPVLLLAGEPGIGKSRLLQAAVQHAVAQGWCVLAGGCQRRGGQEPYAPLPEALAQYLQAADSAQRRAALAGCAWLVRVLPELAEMLEPLPAAAVAAEQERRLIHLAMARLLANVAGPAGTLLVLDDLQWAGPDALDLINTLVRTRAALRIVGAYRDTEVRPADPLGLLLADLAQAGLVSRQPLGPLAAADAAALLQGLLGDVAAGDALVEGVLGRAAGMPFFLVSYALAARQGGVGELPWDLAQGVQQRVALLPAAGQAVLGAAAVVGRRAPRALLAAVTGLAEEALLVGLEATCVARLLLEDGNDAYVFAHDLIREVVEADLGAARRAVLHRKVAETLEGGPGGASPELLAYHYARGSAPEKAVCYLEQAGDHAWSQRAHGAAERHFQEALDRLVPLGHPHEVIRVREKLGEVLFETGRYVQASQVLEQAAEALRAAGDWERLGAVMARIGWMHSLAGTPRDGLALIHPILQQVEQSGAIASAAALYAAHGQLALAAGQYTLSETSSQRAVELAWACGDQRSQVRAEYNILCVRYLLGHLGAAVAHGHAVVPLAEAVGHLHPLCGVLRDLACIHTLRGDFGQGQVYIEQACAVARQMQDPGPVALTLALRGRILALRGEQQAARAGLAVAEALSRQAHRTWYSPYPLILRGRHVLAEGGSADAAALLREGLDLAQWSGDPQALRWASGALAEIEILGGRPEAARARLVPLLDRPGLEECDVTMLLPVLAWARLELGEVDEAAETVEQALRRARPEAMRLALVAALRVQALVALRREQWETATSSLEEGLALARAMPYPHAEAGLLQVEARLHALRGRPEVARVGGAAGQVRLQRPQGSPPGRALDGVAAVQVLEHAHMATTPAGLDRATPATPAARTPTPRRGTHEERATWVLSYLSTVGPISPALYATAMGVDRRTALRDLQALVARGLVVAQGTTKDRRYRLPSAGG